MTSNLHPRQWSWLLALCFVSIECNAAPKGDVDSCPDVTGAVSWLFPLNPPSAKNGRVADGKAPVHLANSRMELSKARLTDLFFTPD